MINNNEPYALNMYSLALFSYTGKYNEEELRYINKPDILKEVCTLTQNMEKVASNNYRLSL